MKKNILRVSIMTAVCVMILSVTAFAAGTFDATSAITTGVSEIQTQVMSVIGAAAPVAIGIAGAVIAIKKGISVFKSLTA